MFILYFMIVFIKEFYNIIKILYKDRYDKITYGVHQIHYREQKTI